MDITNKTILVVGGTSGLGLELARAFATAGSTVAVAGRRRVDEPGIASLTVDVTSPTSIEALRDEALAAYPELDTVVTMSGIMEPEELRSPEHLEVAERTVVTNLLGTIRVATAFTPHLVQRGAGTIVTVSSGIGFVPFPLTPTYGATKAGVHSYSESLREQLRGSGVDVVELVPPHVATTLMGMGDAPSAMPVDDFITETVSLLAQTPTPDLVLVERVRGYLSAHEDGTYAERVAQSAGLLSMLPSRS
jgi:uncharacterized oxidoreductase